MLSVNQTQRQDVSIPTRPENRSKAKIIINSIEQLEKWLQSNGYRGYEPFDGLSSYLRPLTFGNWFAERVLQQIVLRCPFHIRPIVGIKPLHSTKGMGYLARGYLRMWSLTGNREYEKKAICCLDWLIEHQSSGYSGACWGNHYDFSSRAFQLRKYVPIVVWTTHIGQAFLDGYEMIRDSRYLDIARSICSFILRDLPREASDTGSCISYVPFNQTSIHNSNMLAAAMLARTAGFTKDVEGLRVAKSAMEYSCKRQRGNGSWYYAEASKYHWIDNWHTAYNLDSLKCYIENTGDKSFGGNLFRGVRFYKDNFFTGNGRPKYYFDRFYLVDIQSASQAIDTLSYFSDYDESALKLALKVADWTIGNMRDKSGYFYYRKLRWKKVKIPMLHWGQGTMLCALSHLLCKLDRETT